MTDITTEPSYLAGVERARNPTGEGNPYPVGTKDYMAFCKGFGAEYTRLNAFTFKHFETDTQRDAT